jgi:hypothetical protein
VAHEAGATVFAVVFSDGGLPERVTSRLGRAGADKVLVCEGEGLTAPPLDATHGSALYAAVERVPPLMVLFPAGGAGAELGPSLASRLGGAFAAHADIEVGGAQVALADGIGRVFLRRWRRDLSTYRRFDPVELERPVVALLPAGGPPADMGTAEVEVEVIACRTPLRIGVVEVASEPDDQAAISLASILVVVDPALGPAALAELRAAAPAGTVVVDPTAAPAALAASAPRIVVRLGAVPPVASTPRGRVGLVAAAGTTDAQGPAVDVFWPVTPGAGKSLWTELAASLSSLGLAQAKPSPERLA